METLTVKFYTTSNGQRRANIVDHQNRTVTYGSAVAINQILSSEKRSFTLNHDPTKPAVGYQTVIVN